MPPTSTARRFVAAGRDDGRLTNPKAAQIPRTFIYCNNPAVGPFGQFAERLKKDESWRYVALAAGHDSMITAAEDVAALLHRPRGLRGVRAVREGCAPFRAPHNVWSSIYTTQPIEALSPRAHHAWHPLVPSYPLLRQQEQHRVAIVGPGAVGATTAYALLMSGVASRSRESARRPRWTLKPE